MTSNGNGSHNGNGRYPELELDALELDWRSNARWAGISRPYSAKDIDQLRGSVHVEHTLARLGAERLWNLLHTECSVRALGAVTGNQAVHQLEAPNPNDARLAIEVMEDLLNFLYELDYKASRLRKSSRARRSKKSVKSPFVSAPPHQP